MAEGFEPYHVPQQSRRDKLRAAAELHGGLINRLPPTPPYDHRHLIGSSPSDLLTCYPKQDENLMAMADLRSPSSSLRIPYGTAFDPSLLYGDGQLASLKPEPLSLSLGVSRGSASLGPFTGYASVLKGSRFLRPAQQLLEELCRDLVGVISPEPDSSLMVMETNAILDDDDVRDHDDGDDDGDDYEHDRKKKSKLITMLDEVYRKYKQYYQQMQAVITSFEYVAGLENATPFASLAVKSMTRNFRSLKDSIMEQLQFDDRRKQEPTTTTAPLRSTVMSHHNHNQHGASGFLDHVQPVWRPQRGLPEPAVTVLRAWLFEHFLHPYPTDTDKMRLAKRTGLSRSQVSNWFINARVRLWKPMVEEIHMLETRQAHQKGGSKNDDSVPTTSSKRSRGNYNGDLPRAAGPPSTHNVISPYDDHDLSRQLRAAASGGVSLTLGLHQVGGLAQRFGIEGTTSGGGESYMASFGATNHQSRHFGGHLLHDFVG